MTRTLLETALVTALVALLAAPAALAQGPPPGYTDPVAYAQDYAAEQAAAAGADPVGYASGRDPVSEADHALWLACWTAYDQVGHALDPACAPFFTAPVQVNPAAQGAMAEVTQVLNDTGAAALASEALDAVNDTLADPTTAAGQVLRIVHAVLRFLDGIVAFVFDALGLAGLGLGAGLLGAMQGILDLLVLPVQGGRLALGGLADALSGTASAGALAANAWLAGAQATLAVVGSGAAAVAHGAAAGLHGVVDALDDAAAGLAAAGDAVQDGLRRLTAQVASWFQGKAPAAGPAVDVASDLPETGTPADGLLERLLDGL